jgi:sterol desaturase/sphingolipid hydroxylase (fatty acid hydroxylase superfamily)
MQKSRAKRFSGSNPIKAETRVVWWKVLGVVLAGLIFGLIILLYLAENTLTLNTIFQAIELILITCILALLLDIRQIIFKCLKK